MFDSASFSGFIRGVQPAFTITEQAAVRSHGEGDFNQADNDQTRVCFSERSRPVTFWQHCRLSDLT